MNESPKGSKVTLKAIAQRLGLSPATVSFALRNHPKISESRRRQIQQIAREMGYLPNATAVALSQHRRAAKKRHMQPALAWIDSGFNSANSSPAAGLTTYWQAASQEADQLGYRLEPLALPTDTLTVTMADSLRAFDIVGVLFSPGQSEMVASWNLPFDILPAVCLGPLTVASPIRLVTHDDLNDAATAFEQIWTKGYRRIGLVTDSTPRSALYQTGFTYARSQHRRAPAVPALGFSKHHPTAAAWLRRHRPDALLVECRGLLQKLEESVLLPINVAVALLDVASDVHQRFAGMRRNTAEISREAVRTLASLINHADNEGPLPFCHVLVESEWVDGPSLPMRP